MSNLVGYLSKRPICNIAPGCTNTAIVLSNNHGMCPAHFAMMCVNYYAEGKMGMPVEEAQSFSERVVNSILKDYSEENTPFILSEHNTEEL